MQAVTPRGNTLVIRKQVSRMVEHKTILDALTFVKAGDSGGVQQLTKLPVSEQKNRSCMSTIARIKTVMTNFEP